MVVLFCCILCCLLFDLYLVCVFLCTGAALFISISQVIGYMSSYPVCSPTVLPTPETDKTETIEIRKPEEWFLQTKEV